MTERRFIAGVNYLKAVTAFCALACIASLSSVGFDPWHSIDRMVWNDLYRTDHLPAVAAPAFEMIVLLFSWLSFIMFLMLFLITKYALAKRESWAYYSLTLPGFAWPAGAACISICTGANHYLISVGAMAILFIPPMVILFPYFRAKS